MQTMLGARQIFEIFEPNEPTEEIDVCRFADKVLYYDVE